MTNSYKNSSSYAWYDQTFVLSRAMTCQQNGARLSITMVGFIPHFIKIKATSSKPFIKFLYFYLFLWIDWRRFLFVEKKKTILIWSTVLTKQVNVEKLSWFLFLEHAGSRVKVFFTPGLIKQLSSLNAKLTLDRNFKPFTNIKWLLIYFFNFPVDI